MTVLFSDIRSFTAISEKMSANENYDFLNSYLGTVGPTIAQYNGFIDKYIGDAIMAVFDTKADNALEAALKVCVLLQTYNSTQIEQSLKIGIGINSGSVSIGTLGVPDRMDGSVISDAVNLAARVESLTKHYGMSILITSNTHDQLVEPGNFNLRFIDKVIVKGKKLSTELYEVLDHYDKREMDKKLAMQDHFMQAFDRYSKGEFNEALALFRVCYEENSEENFLKIFIERCKFFIQNGPPKNWQGAFKLDTK